MKRFSNFKKIFYLFSLHTCDRWMEMKSVTDQWKFQKSMETSECHKILVSIRIYLKFRTRTVQSVAHKHAKKFCFGQLVPELFKILTGRSQTLLPLFSYVYTVNSCKLQLFFLEIQRLRIQSWWRTVNKCMVLQNNQFASNSCPILSYFCAWKVKKYSSLLPFVYIVKQTPRRECVRPCVQAEIWFSRNFAVQEIFNFI